jgi:hypothetical protein
MDLQSKLILTLLIMFSVLYIFFNIDSIRNGDIFNDDSNYKKPLIIALIGTLVYYLYETWDKKEDGKYSYSIANKRYGSNSSNNSNNRGLNGNFSEGESIIFLAPNTRQAFGIGY